MWWIYAIGFTAQGFFSARILIQWILSERARKVVSPVAYWVCSIVGAYLLFIYGWLRMDFSIILGQVISYYIYLWNLNVKGQWKRTPAIFRIILYATPAVAFVLIALHGVNFSQTFLHNSAVPMWLLVFGSAGQVIFTLRFVYQWIYSARRNESMLPTTFWIISLVGSGIIVAYGIFRLDPVLILGQSVGFIAYSRNIVIGHKQKAQEATVAAN
ncbi:MAG: lipid-A-disaccharide synthase N-terminal domain-containing protein [Muribaculaceae bacterium]|nr:lipid-A-disaccharide synthase N-terminal domain-containing protein [Muribaculaceae bacterium]